MVKTFHPDEGVWRDANGRYASPPPEALNKTFDASQGAWRYEKGHPNAGQYAPSPEPEIVPWSFTDPEGRRIDKEEGGIVGPRTVGAFKGALKRKGLADSTIKEKVRERFDKLYKNPETGDLQSKANVQRRNRNLERAQIFKGWSEGVEGLKYQDLQEIFKGIPTVEIRGKFEGIDERTGEAQYGPPSERVNELLEGEILERFDVALGSPLDFIRTP